VQGDVHAPAEVSQASWAQHLLAKSGVGQCRAMFGSRGRERRHNHVPSCSRLSPGAGAAFPPAAHSAIAAEPPGTIPDPPTPVLGSTGGPGRARPHPGREQPPRHPPPGPGKPPRAPGNSAAPSERPVPVGSRGMTTPLPLALPTARGSNRRLPPEAGDSPPPSRPSCSPRVLPRRGKLCPSAPRSGHGRAHDALQGFKGSLGSAEV